MAQRNDEAFTRQSPRTSKVFSFTPILVSLNHQIYLTPVRCARPTRPGQLQSGVNCILDKNKLYYLLYRQRYYWTICYLWLLFRLLLQFWIHKGRDFNSDMPKSGQRVLGLSDLTQFLTVRPILFTVFNAKLRIVISTKEAKNSKLFQVVIHRILPMKIKMKISQLDFYLLPKLLFS